jgi:hypothetical protein
MGVLGDLLLGICYALSSSMRNRKAVHKMRTPQVIETRWMNRVIVYWIPALFIVYGVAEMADLVSREVTIGP